MPEMPQIPFAFALECNQQNGNSVNRKSVELHSNANANGT